MTIVPTGEVVPSGGLVQPTETAARAGVANARSPAATNPESIHFILPTTRINIAP